jgi:hypothetical protein
MKVTIFCWREKTNGEDFHARNLLTDRGGIAVDAGFSAEGNHQTTDMHLMGYDLSQERLEAFARRSNSRRPPIHSDNSAIHRRRH